MWRVGVVAVALAGAANGLAATSLLGDAKAENGQSFAFVAGQCGPGLFVEWRDRQGALAAREEVSLSGERWTHYRLERPNVGQLIEGSRSGGRLTIRNHRDGKVKVQDIAVTEDVVAGPLLIRRLQAQWPRLSAGKAVELDYLIADQAATLRLRIQRDVAVSGPLSGAWPAFGDTVRLRMEAAQPWMRPFVPQTWLTFDARGNLIAMQGRFLPLAGTRTRQEPLTGLLSLRSANFGEDARGDGESLVSMQSICNMRDLS